MSEALFALDLDEEMIAHLPDQDSWMMIQGEGITADLIEDAFARSVFDYQKKHQREHGKIATAAVLAEQFDLELRAPDTAIGDLLDRLRDRYMRNQGREALREIGELHQSNPLAIPQVLMRKGRELSGLLAKRGEMFGSGDFLRAWRRYEIKKEAGPGASYGLPALDEYFNGMRGLTFWLGPPKSMKSWMMLQGVMGNVEQGRPAFHYSLELPAEESQMRLYHLFASIPWWKYINNHLDMHDRKKLAAFSEAYDEAGVYKIKKPPRGHRGIDEMVYTAREAGAEVVFIDQLQYVENTKGQSLGELNNTGEYWGVLDRARDLSDEGPICIAHQFNRSTMYADSMPDVQQAKGSSAVEETATLVLGIWGDRDMRRRNEMEIGTLIARNHQYASWELETELHHGCSFTVVGRKAGEEEE